MFFQKISHEFKREFKYTLNKNRKIE